MLALYAALAEVVADPERRLWHRAGAAVGFDEEIAAALEAHATSALRGAARSRSRPRRSNAPPRSAPTRAARAAAWSRAADVAYELGLVEAVAPADPPAEPIELGPLEAARLAWLRQMISGDVWVQAGATRTFVEIATQMAAGGDRDAALGSLVPIAHRCWWTRTRARTRQYLVEAAEAIGSPADDPRVLAVIALADPEGTAALVRGRLAALRGARGRRPAGRDAPRDRRRKGWRLRRRRAASSPAPSTACASRAGSAPLTQALVHHAWAATHTGDWETAVAAAGLEAARLADDTRQPAVRADRRLGRRPRHRPPRRRARASTR